MLLLLSFTGCSIPGEAAPWEQEQPLRDADQAKHVSQGTSTGPENCWRHARMLGGLFHSPGVE